MATLPPQFFLLQYLNSFADCEVVQHKVLEVDEYTLVSRSRIMIEVMRQGTAVTLWIGEKDEEHPLHTWVDNDPIPFDYFSTWFLQTVGKKQIFVKEFYATQLEVIPKAVCARYTHKPMWKGYFRLKLEWGDRTVVIGDMITDQVSSILPEPQGYMTWFQPMAYIPGGRRV